MSLIELIAGVEASEATLTVFNADPAVRETLAEHFADRNVRVVAAETDAGPDEFAVLARDEAFVTAVSIDDLLPERNPDATGTSSTDGDGRPRRTGRPVLDRMDETLFTSYSNADMVAASREIEDRAWRVGDGELHAGFQTLDVLTGEARTYSRLATLADLDVHAYAAAEGDAPEADRYTVHIERAPEIRETWFVAYDGGGFDDAKCVLLAEEREPGRFYGFWSYDPETVDEVIDYLTDRYGSPEPTGDDGTVV
ncbi:DICT sensory domain-containing protein [Halorubrum sp. DTA98]|uniref:DICT sensory domain-containing protein n=1 Tax=Halorubrum sp. DTA98 TaxID=3402163 RepID=UPI003AB098F9